MSNKILKGSVDIFIIPNRAYRIDDLCCSQEEYKEYFEKLCSANDTIFFSRSIIAETWMVGKDNVESENLADHGFYIKDGEHEYRVFTGTIKRDVPVKLLPVKEGETVELVYPNVEVAEIVNDSYTGNKEVVDIHLQVTANQLSYRYARFGKFEETLKQVC